MNTGLVTPRIPLLAYGRSPDHSFSRRPVQPHAEDGFEVAGVPDCGRLGLDPLSSDSFDRGRPPIRVTAWDDALEVVQVGGQVQGESVADHGAVELDPDRRQLLAVPPDACKAGLARL